MNYPSIEPHCLVLIFTTSKLRHYLLTHLLNLVIRSNPLKYLLCQPIMSRANARWLLQLKEFDIIVVTPRGLRSQALTDLLYSSALKDTNVYAKTCSMKKYASCKWRLTSTSLFLTKGWRWTCVVYPQ